MIDEHSPEVQRMYEEIAASIRASMEGFVERPYNRAQMVAAVQRTLTEQAERFGSNGGATHALVAPARAEGRPWLWGLPCFGVSAIPDDQVVLARFAGVAPPQASATDTPGQVTLTVSFAPLRTWPVTWPEAGEPMIEGLINVREVSE